MSEKKKELENSAQQYGTKVIEGWSTLYQKKRQKLVDAFSPYFKKGSALELGVADGVMTSKLVSFFDDYTIVDGSKLHLEQTIKFLSDQGIQSVYAVYSFFEDFNPSKKYDVIMMTHILEHMDHPIDLLKKARSWLKPEGLIFLAVPNCNSLHRYIGVELGMIEQIDSLNEQDKILGHKRVYGPELFKKHIQEAGLSVIKFGGLMVKPLSNRQIESQWTDDLINAFFAISNIFPELCSEIYAITEAKQ